MTPAEQILFAASRKPRGTPCIPLGRVDGARDQLDRECVIADVVWLEVHPETGVPQQMPMNQLHRIAAQCYGPAHVIGFTKTQLVELAETQHVEPVNLFSLLEADRIAAAANPAHQRRFLTPSELRMQLTGGARLSIAPVDYAHRCDEIEAAVRELGSDAPGHARSFLSSAQKYRAFVPNRTAVPEFAVHFGRAYAADCTAELSALRRPLPSPTIEAGAPETNVGQLGLF